MWYSTKPVCSTGVHKISLQYRCTQNLFAVKVYTKPVCSTVVLKTSLQYSCTQNQFTVQVYTKPVYSTLFKFFCLKFVSSRKISSSKIFFLTIFTNIWLEQLLRTFEVLVMSENIWDFGIPFTLQTQKFDKKEVVKTGCFTSSCFRNRAVVSLFLDLWCPYLTLRLGANLL